MGFILDYAIRINFKVMDPELLEYINRTSLAKQNRGPEIGETKPLVSVPITIRLRMVRPIVPINVKYCSDGTRRIHSVHFSEEGVGYPAASHW